VHKTTTAGLILVSLFAVSACDTGPYNPSLHHHEDASLGSMLPGTDTSSDGSGNLVNNPAMRSSQFTGGNGH
jgi:hypothetical protein